MSRAAAARVRGAVRLVLVALAVTGPLAPASAQTLWQNVTVGMSADQIRAAQPSATRPSAPDRIHSGATCELQIPTYRVANQNFSVCFFMLGGRLVQVTLSAQIPTRPLFDTLADLLRSRYGTELSPRSDPCEESGSLNLCELEWLQDSGVNVNLIYIDVGRRNPIININYQTRLRDEGVRL